MDKNAVWRKLFTEPPCKTAPCSICCWFCEFLSECFEEWKDSKHYCQKEEREAWCSTAKQAYQLVKEGL